MASSGEIDIAALGRPFALGMLYDCRKDALIPGITLWDNDELKKNTTRNAQPSSEFKVTSSDSIDDKLNSLTVSGSLKLSVLGGLVNVAGSGKYFQDTKKSHKQERLTFHYKTTTRYEALTMSHLGRGKVSHPNVFDDDTATHVVIAILYGASAYFVFDRESSSDDENKQVKVEAKLMMSKLKYLIAGPDIKTEAAFQMDEKEKSAVENFSCTFHGDVQLPSNPATFNEAVDVYRQLPKMLGENGEHAVPVRVWLYPLVKLDSKAAKLQREISNKLITYSSGVIEHLNKTEMSCNDLLKETSVRTFSAMEEKLQTFMENCLQYKLEFVQKLGLVLPSIRGGGQEESALEEILKAHEKSPFNSKDLDQWLTNKGKESDTVKLFLKQLQDEHDAKVNDILNDQLSVLAVQNVVVSFSFTSLGNQDYFLNELANVLKPEMMRNEEESNTVQTKITCWNNRCYRSKKTGWNSDDTMKRMTKQLQLFAELKRLTSNDDTKFTVGSKYNEDYPGACILIYEYGCEPVPFIPPVKPATPSTSGVSSDGLTVIVSDPEPTTGESKVEYRMKQESEWKAQPVQKNEKTVTLLGLKPDTKYEIRVTAVGKLGYSVSSDAVTALTLKSKNINSPTNVQATKVKANSITLSWSNPERCEDLKQYIIEYKEENSSDWQKEETKKTKTTFTLKNLKENTTYCIRVCTDVGKGLVSQSDEVLMMKTKKGPLDTRRFTPLSGHQPSVYLLNMTDASAGQCSKKVFGEAPAKNPLNKTIMLVGATGSGKTTLINGMINYILGVDWEDNWRFKLIDEESRKSQAHSQTSEVTAYQIYHTDEFQVPYSLTIIDTPGFGDTRGTKKDKEITDKIREFFTNKKGIDAIEAVCFVVQASSSRLTHTQKYIFESILSVFGKDIASNIIPLVTFADGKCPPVLEAIKEAEIPCATLDGSPVHFKLNNSVLFASNKGEESDETDFDLMFWKMVKASMKNFFTHLEKMEAQSLTLTKEVLQERKQLATTVDGMQPLIRKGLSTMEEIRMTQAILDKNKMQIEANKDFEYEVDIEKSERIDIPTGTFITHCHKCNFTCYYPCQIITDGEKNRCDAMSDDGQCMVCPGKCALSSHSKVTNRWEIKRVRERRTYQDLKSKFEAALGEKMSKEKMMKQFELEYHQVQGKVIEMMETVTTSLERLKEIALHPDPLATLDYIDLLIQSEKQESKPGFKQRIKELKEVRKGVVIIQKVAEKIENLSVEDQSKFHMIKSKAKAAVHDFLVYFK